MKKTIIIDNIFGGHAPSFHFAEKGQILTSLGIDPDVPVSDTSTDIKTGGVIRPVAYGKFSSTVLDQPPLWILTTPKNTKTYVYGASGDIVSYASALTSASETLERAVSSSSGNGFAYYNNALYYATNTDVGRYTPLDGSPAFTDNFWTGTLAKTTLSNTTYPTARHSVKYPNHPMHVHVDNKLYFGDFTNGVGYIHYIRTKRVTDQGDTDNGSAYGALTLPFGFMPFCIKSYGNMLAIGACQSSDGTINQGNAVLFLWDGFSSSFSRAIRIPDPYLTALEYNNGILYGWSGNMQGGVRFWRYLGGDAIQTLHFFEEGLPPLAGAVDTYGNRVVWGGLTTYPDNSASVYAYGSKSDLFPRGLHNIAISSVTATASNGLLSALKNVEQANSAFPRFILGGTDGTNTNLDKKGTTYQTHYFRSAVQNVGSEFRVTNISLRLGQTLAANMTVTAKLYFDNESSSQAATTINSTNFSGKFVNLTANSFSGNTGAFNNFHLELKFTGTALVTFLLPIEIEIDIYDNPLR